MEKPQVANANDEQMKRIAHLEKLSKVLRYAGINLMPQILGVVLDKPLVELIDKFDSALQADPDLPTSTIDAIIDEIQAAQAAQAEAAQAEEAPKKKAPKLDKA